MLRASLILLSMTFYCIRSLLQLVIIVYYPIVQSTFSISRTCLIVARVQKIS